VASIEDAQEFKLAVLANFTSAFIVNHPGFVVLLTELFLVFPLGTEGPGLTATPVADPVLITGVDKNLNFWVVVKDVCNIGHKVGHPVTEEVGVYQGIALFP